MVGYGRISMKSVFESCVTSVYFGILEFCNTFVSIQCFIQTQREICLPGHLLSTQSSVIPFLILTVILSVVL